MKAKDFFTHFAEKAGIDTSEKSFTDFLKANESLEIPDSFATEAQNKLMNEDDAKKSSVIAGHFKSQTLSGVDTELERLLAELQLDDESKGVIKAEKSTFKRVPLLIQKVKELEAKKAEAGKGDKAELVKKINDLNAEILKIQADSQNLLKQKDEETQKNNYDWAFRYELGSRTYANDKVPKHVNTLTAYNVIQDALAAKKAKAVLDGNKFKLVSAENPDLPFRENHKDISFEAFIDKTLGEAQLLKVSEPPKPGNHNATPAPAGLQDHDLQALNMVKELSAKQLASRNGSH